MVVFATIDKKVTNISNLVGGTVQKGLHSSTFEANRDNLERLMLFCQRLKIWVGVLVVFTAAHGFVKAQSLRPGWGSVPYHDAGGTGVTFRVWAPNASSVYVPGQFNNWSATATPLAKELPNGVWN